MRVKACCPECGLHRVAKLKRIEALKGRDYCMFDRKPACPVCGKPGFFIYSPGRTTPFRPMRNHV